MQTVEALIDSRWVVPVAPQGTILEDHAVVVDSGRIVDVLPTTDAHRRYNARTRHALANHVLTPGLINVHTHGAMALMRGVGDDLPLMRWLSERIWPLEADLVSESFVYDGTRLAALEMLRGGVTTCSDMYFFPDAAARALRSIGMRAVVGIIAIEFPSAYASDADDYLRKGLAARDALHDDPLIGFTIAPHAPYTVSDETLMRVVTLAEELDLPIHIHLHETAHEVAESIEKFGVRPLARLQRLGLVSERLIAVHAVHLSEHDIEQLARAAASVAHCPASNLKLGSGIAPIAALVRAGVNVALGTDGAASNNRLDVVAEMRLAALLAKGVTGDPSILPAAQALECATINAARALGLEKRIGSIEIGKEADLAAFELTDLQTQPVFDPLSHLVYVCGREHVSDVWVAGKHVVRARQFITHEGKAGDGAVVTSFSAWQNQCRQSLKKSA